MPEQRLLERLAKLEREPLRRERPSHGCLVDSILGHLRCLLNTRQGGVPIAADYGVPDFVDFLQRFPESTREIESSIRRSVERYEPRLTEVQVTFLPDEEELLSLNFHIEARVRGGNGARVSFRTVLESDGKVEVTR